MNGWATADRKAAISLALLRATLLVVIFFSEQLIDARQLAESSFFVVLGIAAAYAMACLAVAAAGTAGPAARIFLRLQPSIDILLLAFLAYTSGGAYSDVRKAFFVVPLAAAFSERPRSPWLWSLAAILAFTVQAAIAGGHPSGAVNSWQRLTLNQDIYLAWTAAAGALLAVALRTRSAETNELARSRQHLITHAIESVERERTRLANALHDSPVQNLIAARHDLRRAERSGDPDSFLRLRGAIDTTVEQLREEIFNLHPHVLDHVGLRAALEQVARRWADQTGVRVTVQIDPDAGLADRQVLFALGRELLCNAAKHAEAANIALILTREGDCVTLDVEDDGCGIRDGRLRQALVEGHVGLAAVGERVAVLGGSVAIKTEPGTGTRVLVKLPANESEPATATIGLQAASSTAPPVDAPRPARTVAIWGADARRSPIG